VCAVNSFAGLASALSGSAVFTRDILNKSKPCCTVFTAGLVKTTVLVIAKVLSSAELLARHTGGRCVLRRALHTTSRYLAATRATPAIAVPAAPTFGVPPRQWRWRRTWR